MDCPHKGKWFGGCKFEPRYDLSPADVSAITRINGYNTGELLDRMRTQTYRGDVCVRCGECVNATLDTGREITPNQAGS